MTRMFATALASLSAAAPVLASVLATFLATMPTPAAADQALVCPAHVQLNAATAKATVTFSADTPGFTPLVSDRLLALTGASAFDGPPEEGAALKPVTERRGAAYNTSVWRFEGSYDGGKWMTCDYAQGLVRLAVRVEDTAQVCEARATLAKANARVTVALACR